MVGGQWELFVFIVVQSEPDVSQMLSFESSSVWSWRNVKRLTFAATVGSYVTPPIAVRRLVDNFGVVQIGLNCLKNCHWVQIRQKKRVKSLHKLWNAWIVLTSHSLYCNIYSKALQWLICAISQTIHSSYS